MLTVVGGYYVNLNSIGELPLGANLFRVAVTRRTFSIRTLNVTTKITKLKPINESLNAIQKGLKGTNVEAPAAITRETRLCRR